MRCWCCQVAAVRQQGLCARCSRIISTGTQLRQPSGLQPDWQLALPKTCRVNKGRTVSPHKHTHTRTRMSAFSTHHTVSDWLSSCKTQSCRKDVTPLAPPPAASPRCAGGLHKVTFWSTVLPAWRSGCGCCIAQQLLTDCGAGQQQSGLEEVRPEV